MRRGSPPPVSRNPRRFAAALLAALAGLALRALLPVSAAAATPHSMHGERMTMHAPSAVLAQAAPTPPASMVPHAPSEVRAGPALKRVLEGLMCRCGCNLTVYACEGTMTCEVSVKMRADAERLLARGMTPDEVLTAFATDYGEQVLAAPTKRGFNLTVWILPFVVLGAGGVIVAYALRNWRPGAAASGAPDDQAPPPVDPRYLADIERELDEEG